MTSKTKRSKALYGTVGMTPIVAMMVTSTPAHAVLLSNASNTVSLCSGVQLPNSDITNVVSGLTSTVGSLESTTNGLVGTVSSLLGIQPVTTNITGVMQQASQGSVTLQAVSTNGTLIGPSTGCYAQASGVTLSNPAGISIGGNAITGLGDGTRPVATAGEFGSIALGNNANTAATAANSIAIGPDAAIAANATGSVAIGSTAQASVANSVALGQASMASRGAQTNYTGFALTAPQTSVGEISVGSGSGQRQITNVAAGSAGTDAVNVNQLSAVNDRVTGVSNQVVTNTTNINNLTNNLATTNNNLAVTNNNVTNLQNNIVNGNIGIWRYSDANGVPTGGTTTNNVTIIGGTSGPVGVHNVANGTVSASSNDAINGSQLYGLQQTVSSNNTTVNNSITNLTNQYNSEDNRVTNLSNVVNQNSTNITNLTNQTTSNTNSITNLNNLAVEYNDTTHAQITLGGGSGGTKITNLANGAVSGSSTDAVNGSQLYATNQNITNQINTVNNTIAGVNNLVTQNTNAINTTNTNVTNLGNQVTNIDARVTNNTNNITTNANNITNVGNQLTALSNAAVQYDASNHTQITLGGNGGTTITNLKAGNVSATSTDAVDGAQLYGLQQTVNGNNTTINNQITNLNNNLNTTNTNVTNLGNTFNSFASEVTNGGIGPVQYSNGGATPNGGTPTQDLTLVGGVNGAVHLHNVADGNVAAGSNDAVNGEQLYATNQAVSQNTTNITNLGNQVTNNTTSITNLGAQVTNNTTNITNVGNQLTALSNSAVQYDASNHTQITLGGNGGTLLTNLKAGNVSANSTDAVDGAQLYGVQQSITNVSGGLNTQITNINNNVNNLTNNFNSFSTEVANGGIGPVQYSNGGTTPNGGVPSQDLTLVGANASAAVHLHNVADGQVAAGSTDAVNGEQLYATNQAVSQNSTSITNINNAVTQNTTNITNVGNQLTALGNSAVQYDGSDHTRITLGGNGGTTITNLKAGDVSANSTDAVDGSQLYSLQQTVTGNTTTINNQITNLNNSLTTTNTNVSNLTNNFNSFSTEVANGGIGPVQYSNGGTTPNGGTPTQDLTLVGGANGAVHLHNVADGQIAAGSTDAVNGGQIFALEGTLGGLSGLAVTYDDLSKSSVTLGGVGSTTAVSLKNVAAGRLSQTSTDAVNGAQLYATNQSIGDVQTNISNIDNSVTSISNQVTNNTNDITNLGNQVTQNTTNITNLGSQVTNIDARVTQNTTDITNLGGRTTLLENGGAGPVQYTNGGVTPNGGQPTNDLALVGADSTKPVALHNVADGVVAHGSTDAVNGGQLFDAVQSGVSDLAVVYDDASHTKVSLGGTGAPAVLLTNVQAGDVSANSTDAVNGSQLYATDQRVNAVSQGLFVTNNQVSQNTTDITNVTGNLNTFETKVSNGGVGPVQYSDANGVANGGVPSQDLTLIGANAGSVGLHNVAAGALSATSNDAINGSQLFNLGNQVASKLGSFTYNAATNSLQGSFTYGGNTYTDVQSVLGAINASTTSGIPADGKYFHANSDMADSSASGVNSTAIGPTSSSAGVSSVALGSNASAQTDQSVAIGSNAVATGGMAVSIGMGNTASGDGAVAIGDPSSSTGDGAVVLGKDDNANGDGAIALGDTNTATGTGATAIGTGNTSNGDGAVALGADNSSSGLGSIAIGSNNQVNGNGSLALGSGIVTSATDTLAIGSGTSATAVSAVAIGNRAAAGGADSLAVGNDSDATGVQTSAFGQKSSATGPFSTAIGGSSSAASIATTAVGYQSSVQGNGGTALGAGATVTYANSVALGAAVQTTRGEQDNYDAFGLTGAQNSIGEVAIAQNMEHVDPATGTAAPLGNRQITGVAAGSADTDAVNVAQLKGVSSSIGTSLASSLGGGATYNSTTGQITGPSYVLGGVSFTNVGDAIEALARSNGTGGGSSTPITVVDPNAVAYDDASKSSVTLAAGGTAIHNVADGAVSATSTDAVNGSQLNTVQTQVSTLSTQVQNGAIGTVQYSSAATPTQANGGTKTNDVTLVGANASAAVGLHNVADGTVAVGSTDAVNGNQLAQTNAHIATVETTANTALSQSANSAQYDDAAHDSMTLGGANASAAVGLHNVADGTSAHDAVNLGQLGAATQSAVEQANSYTDQQVKALSFDLSKVRKDASAGVAGAMALAGMPQPTEAGRSMISMGAGAFQGQQAIALGIAKALSDEHTVIKFGATYNTRGQVGANVGIGYQF